MLYRHVLVRFVCQAWSLILNVSHWVLLYMAATLRLLCGTEASLMTPTGVDLTYSKLCLAALSVRVISSIAF